MAWRFHFPIRNYDFKASSYFAPRTFRKSLRQDRPTTRVLLIGQRSRVLFKCATAATHCATLVVHARDPFPVSAYVRCRLEKSPSFSFCQVDMYALRTDGSAAKNERTSENIIRRVTWSPGILGWQKICGWRASRVFCRDSFPVCLHLLTNKIMIIIMIMFCIGAEYIEHCSDGWFYFFIIQNKRENEENLG